MIFPIRFYGGARMNGHPSTIRGAFSMWYDPFLFALSATVRSEPLTVTAAQRRPGHSISSMGLAGSGGLL